MSSLWASDTWRVYSWDFRAFSIIYLWTIIHRDTNDKKADARRYLKNNLTMVWAECNVPPALVVVKVVEEANDFAIFFPFYGRKVPSYFHLLRRSIKVFVSHSLRKRLKARLKDERRWHAPLSKDHSSVLILFSNLLSKRSSLKV